MGHTLHDCMKFIKQEKSKQDSKKDFIESIKVSPEELAENMESKQIMDDKTVENDIIDKGSRD